jgi:subtilisin family serine protease
MLRYFRLVSAIGVFAVAMASAPRMTASQEQPQEPEAPGRGQPRASSTEVVTNDVYIVEMSQQPVLRYTGGIAGLAPTKPARQREKLDPNDTNVASYVRYLDSRHDAALGGAGRKLYGYHHAFNGFAARLTPSEVEALRNTPGVVRVTKDELVTVDTSSTPTFLGLDQPGGLWDELAGPERAGENIIIGIVDSGVWPESLSFADRKDWKGTPSATGGLVYGYLREWRDRCQSGEQFTSNLCNNKLIGAQRFNAAWGGDAGIEAQRPWEFTSPRDYNGHGTHVAATAGGNHGVPTTGDAALFGPVSGIAPGARIAAYKALWSLQDGSMAQGFTSDLVAAIDKAVADGVDIINYSVSGTMSNLADPAEIAFFNAAASGVFVAASAGNNGPTSGTVAHPSPWITTVAAGTHNRTGEGSVTLGNGLVYRGPSLAHPAGPAPLILSSSAGLAGANATSVRLCFAASDNLVNGIPTPVLDPAKVSGKIVVCDRGTNARVNKSLAVQEAGGIGMILVNTSSNSLNADFHFVPTIHLSEIDAAAIKTYVTSAGAGAAATIHQATIVFNVPAPNTAAFSSRGPLSAGGGDLLKPDVIAPGQDILAAVAPPGNAGRTFNVYSGTSMSAPHVAGLAALLMQLKNEDGHDDHQGGDEDDQNDDDGWSPMMIKSALMTTATDVLDGSNISPAVIFGQGAGHVSPNEAASPGLVFDSDENDWLAFMCGAAPASVDPAICNELAQSGFSFDASDLNVASIAIGDLAGVQTVTRRVTNVGHSRATYTASLTGMAGIDVQVSPASFTIRPGRSQTFTVTFTRTTAPTNTYTGGQLTLTDGDHNVRIPMVIRPRSLAAPAQVFSAGGPISYDVKFGYSGAFSATPRGLVPALALSGMVDDDPANSFNPNGGEGITAFEVNVPAGTTYARFSLFDSHVTPRSDLDLYVFRGSALVGGSGGSTAQEEVNLLNPAGGTYIVFVHGFDVLTPPGTASFTLFTWALGSTSAGNMTIDAPAAAVAGATGTINLSFSGLTAGEKYLGSVLYSGATNMPNPTIVRVDP